MHPQGTEKRLPAPTPQGRLEQIGRGTRVEWRREGVAGETKKERRVDWRREDIIVTYRNCQPKSNISNLELAISGIIL